MEEIIKAVVDNGLGITSFVVLIYFVFTYVKEINITMIKISDTMVQMQISMEKMSDRIDKIEDIINMKRDD
mgnify:CR=1 FL=1